MSKSKNLILATADCETDPFAYGIIPKPFVWGFYSEAEGYCHFWGEGETREEQEESCINQFLEFLYALKDPHVIYMHNGGKFDFLFLMEFLDGTLKIVNGRILEARIGSHVIRDSYAAVPIPLAAYKKDDIDYALLAHEKRQANKSAIIHYLGGDVRYLFEMMFAYHAEFGNVLTIGTAAMRALSEHHEFEEFDSTQDAFFRQFYFGGRNQCFEVGEIRGNLKVFDINSSYPYTMANFYHPISRAYDTGKELTDDTDFLIVTGHNFGAIAFKDPVSYGLDFTRTYGTFYTTGHELRAGLETGTFVVDKIDASYTFSQRTKFDTFVETYFSKRLQSKENGEELYDLFWKLILNSGYGKFCLNSDNFKDWMITASDEFLDDSIWNVEHQHGEYILWSKPTAQHKFYNVATGASITGGSRAQLLRGLSQATRPVYCDTDSIICTDFTGTLDDKKLGAWKLEAEADTLYIAGKKLYVLYDKGEPYLNSKGKGKQASKGTRLTAPQIKNAALGGVETFNNPVPSFKLDGNHQFISRRVRKTAFDVKPFGYGK
jgi:DNA polymerase elongation subunit (family B)